MSTPCQRAAWAEEPALPGSSSYGCLARTCWGRSYPATTQKPVLLGRVGKGEGRFSRWLPFGLEPNGLLPRGAAVVGPCSAAAACEEWVLPNKVAPARGVHAMPEGGVGGGACTSRFLQLWVPGTNLLGPKLSRNDAKASPPGARRKGRRALLPLATVRSRAGRIPRSILNEYSRRRGKDS